MTRTTLVLRYTAFAILATLANLGVQRIVLMGGEGAVIFALAMVAGTAAGLVLKYILDKRYIFNDSTTGLRASGQQFLLYTVMGLVTTALFWATETAFWLIWRTDAMRELGAVLGLSVGYVVKYKLDSKYVFTRTEATA
ncbi:MAG: GtrA family protein [Fuscovulum sp.]|nr:GtrA family protein [Paracoccaceae bacterium]MCZ8082047.1 GtrA family protein [Paracoccaceae bacterium]WRH63312.1 MAG: GtrA family protein [Fuscovulum sp.]